MTISKHQLISITTITIVALLIVGGFYLYYSRGQSAPIASEGVLRSQYEEKASSMSNSELKQSIMTLYQLWQDQDDTGDGKIESQMSVYISEYQKRVPNDSTVTSINDALDSKYNPCWGIQEGQCRE